MPISNESAATEQGNSVQQGTEKDTGQASFDASGNDQGQPNDNMSTDGQPNGGDSNVNDTNTPDTNITPEETMESLQVKFDTMNKDYNSLQTEFSKRNESSKEITDAFQAFGGVEKSQQYLQYLAGNERFSKFIADEQQRELIGGQDTTEMDQEQKDALALVQKMIDTSFDNKIQNVIGDKVNPIIEENRSRSISDNLVSLEKKWGQVFSENRDLMKSEVDANANNPVYANPTYDQLEDLMWNAIRRSGKQEHYMALAHNNVLQQKKQNSTEQPSTTTTTNAPVNARSIKEAMEAAKRELGIVGEVRAV